MVGLLFLSYVSSQLFCLPVCIPTTQVFVFQTNCVIHRTLPLIFPGSSPHFYAWLNAIYPFRIIIFAVFLLELRGLELSYLLCSSWNLPLSLLWIGTAATPIHLINCFKLLDALILVNVVFWFLNLCEDNDGVYVFFNIIFPALTLL